MPPKKLIAGKKCAPEHLGHVLVLGLGKSGRAAAEYCLGLLGGRVASLAVAAGNCSEESEAFAEVLRSRGAHVAFGDDALTLLAAHVPEGRFDLCIPSPGIPPFAALYVAAVKFSEELISEVEFAWRESSEKSRWVAVTGTNGKTTVVSYITHILNVAGVRAAAVGNIGVTCLDAVIADDVDVYVAEVSSYQLASTTSFAPNVAVLLNITPDHLHWHGTYQAYCDAKFKVLANREQAPNALAVLDATNDTVRKMVRSIHAEHVAGYSMSYIPLGTAEGLCGDMRVKCGSENAAFIKGEGVLCVAFAGKEHMLVSACELPIKGEHNISNALAAASVVLALGVSVAHTAEGLRNFSPLEHRIEPCGSIGSVVCFNDSKATNVDATLKALASFPQAALIVLLGGEDKGTDLSTLVAAVHKRAYKVVCFGASGRRFMGAFNDAANHAPQNFVAKQACCLEDALDVALEEASSGDVILLSPACASFDEFSSFEERGRAFKALVAQRTIPSKV